MKGRINARHLLFILIIAGNGEDILSDGTDEGKGGVEYQGGIQRTLYILIGVRQGDRTDGSGETSTHACYAEGY